MSPRSVRGDAGVKRRRAPRPLAERTFVKIPAGMRDQLVHVVRRRSRRLYPRRLRLDRFGARACASASAAATTPVTPAAAPRLRPGYVARASSTTSRARTAPTAADSPSPRAQAVVASKRTSASSTRCERERRQVASPVIAIAAVRAASVAFSVHDAMRALCIEKLGVEVEFVSLSREWPQGSCGIDRAKIGSGSRLIREWLGSDFATEWFVPLFNDLSCICLKRPLAGRCGLDCITAQWHIGCAFNLLH